MRASQYTAAKGRERVEGDLLGQARALRTMAHLLALQDRPQLGLDVALYAAAWSARLLESSTDLYGPWSARRQRCQKSDAHRSLVARSPWRRRSSGAPRPRTPCNWTRRSARRGPACTARRSRRVSPRTASRDRGRAGTAGVSMAHGVTTNERRDLVGLERGHRLGCELPDVASLGWSAGLRENVPRRAECVMASA